MGTMSFLLPAGMPADLARELERSCLAGGPDNMPWLTEVRLAKGKLTLRREVDESGCLMAPWDFNGLGRFMGTSGTLMEREAPYPLLTELARGKVNQLRSQAWEWHSGGLPLPTSRRR